MCTASTAKRRRSQAANGYKHLDVMKRPIYKKRSQMVLQRRLEAQIIKERMIAINKGKKAKKN